MGDVEIAISAAPTARSKCQACKETIQKDEMRISFPGRHNGITVTKWLHPLCFAEKGVLCDYAPTEYVPYRRPC